MWSARLNHFRRVICNGIGFAIFGASTLLIAFVVVPASRLLARERTDPDLRAQRSIQGGARFIVWVGRVLGLMRVSWVGAERLSQGGPQLVVANHPTLVDVVALCAAMPQADCIVNVARAENFFLRKLVATAGYVPNNGGLRIVEECARRLQAGRSVVVFPEGTRSPVGGLGEFRRGAARIALATGHPLLPVVITCDPPTLGKGQKWYDVPERSFQLTLRVQDAIPSEPLRRSGLASSLAARRLTAELRESLMKGLDIAEFGNA